MSDTYQDQQNFQRQSQQPQQSQPQGQQWDKEYDRNPSNKDNDRNTAAIEKNRIDPQPKSGSTFAPQTQSWDENGKPGNRPDDYKRSDAYNNDPNKDAAAVERDRVEAAQENEVETDPRKIDPIKVDNIHPSFLSNSPFYSPGFSHPYDELKPGEALFLGNEYGQTTDKHIELVYREIAQYKNFMSDVERDENGDVILEQVVIEDRKRDKYGNFIIEPDGNILKGALHESRPKLIYYKHFVARAITKGQELSDNVKAERDGVLVIRVN